MRRVEVNISTDFWDDRKKGKPKLIKKGIITKRSIDIDDVVYVEEMFNNNGNIIKKKCKIHLKDVGDLLVEHPYEYIHDLLNTLYKRKIDTKIGFNYKGRK